MLTADTPALKSIRNLRASQRLWKVRYPKTFEPVDGKVSLIAVMFQEGMTVWLSLVIAVSKVT